MKRIYIDYHPKRVKVALVENGEVVEFYIERSSMPKLVGNIYKGKVVNVLSSMKAAFVKLLQTFAWRETLFCTSAKRWWTRRTSSNRWAREV